VCRQIAATHRRSVTQETIHLIEKAIAAEETALPASSNQSKIGQPEAPAGV